MDLAPINKNEIHLTVMRNGKKLVKKLKKTRKLTAAFDVIKYENVLPARLEC